MVGRKYVLMRTYDQEKDQHSTEAKFIHKLTCFKILSNIYWYMCLGGKRSYQCHMGMTDAMMCINSHMLMNDTCVEDMILDLTHIHNTILCFVCTSELIHTELAISDKLKVRLSSIISQNLIKIAPTESAVNEIMDHFNHVRHLLHKCSNVEAMEDTFCAFYPPNAMTNIDEKISHQAKTILTRIINHKPLDKYEHIHERCLKHVQQVSKPFKVYIGPIEGMSFKDLLFIEECCLRLCQCVIQKRSMRGGQKSMQQN
jgi:hypothetical protein